MKVYTTKYALTAGIETVEAKYGIDGEKYVYAGAGPSFQAFIMGKTAFLTYEEAAVAARVMRTRKIASVEKQLNRLTGLLFPTKEPENL